MPVSGYNVPQTPDNFWSHERMRAAQPMQAGIKEPVGETLADPSGGGGGAGGFGGRSTGGGDNYGRVGTGMPRGGGPMSGGRIPQRWGGKRIPPGIASRLSSMPQAARARFLNQYFRDGAQGMMRSISGGPYRFAGGGSQEQELARRTGGGQITQPAPVGGGGIIPQPLPQPGSRFDTGPSPYERVGTLPTQLPNPYNRVGTLPTPYGGGISAQIDPRYLQSIMGG